MKKLLCGMVGSAIFLAMNAGAESKFSSGPQETSLIELYTSEGCSSCPPAEAWLSHLQENPGLWQRFVPIAFHVDYWNNLGWRDRFSSARWTERQRNYAALWQSESVYTPAVVKNGAEVRNWSGSDPTSPNDAKPGLLSASTSDGKTFQIDFNPASGDSGDWQAHLALLGSGISSRVGAGENGGRTLKHDFVVLEMSDVEMKPESGSLKARIKLTQPTEAGARKAVAVWVTRAASLAPVQATGGWLP